jgi:NAD(P)-dependent dehydrogenase (short-subunit alcohol dehydrogenase family)
VYGLIASGKATAYHAAKGGVLMVSRAAAVEYAQDGIRVNSIHPGLIDTPMTETLPPLWKASLLDVTPMKRSASADEVARAALFLVSDDASFSGRRTDRSLTAAIRFAPVARGYRLEGDRKNGTASAVATPIWHTMTGVA